MSARPETVDRPPAGAGWGLTAAGRSQKLRRGVQDALVLAHRAFAWWVGELAAMLPARLRERLSSPASRLVVALDGSRATLLLDKADELQRIGGVALDGDPAATLRPILQRHGLATALAAETATVGLRLPADKALRTVISLPLAAESNLNEVILFELDRHTPFKAEQVYVSTRTVRRDQAARRLEVELTVLPRAVADEALRLAERLGVPVDRLDVTNGLDGSAASGNLLPQSQMAARRRKASRVTYALAAAAAVLLVLAVYIPLAHLRREAAATEQQFAAVRAAAALQRQVQEIRSQQRFIVDRKRATVPLSTLLLELTRLLPDDTSLTTVQVIGDEIQLGGTTHSAAGLIGLLEQSHEFKDTKFRTPVTQDPVTGLETFYIAARIVGDPPP